MRNPVDAFRAWHVPAGTTVARMRRRPPAARYGFSPTGTGGGSLRSRSVMRRLEAR